MRKLKWIAVGAGALALAGFTAVWGASAYYSRESGTGCASCHEMNSFVIAAHDSPHRTVACLQCHQTGLRTKLRHTWVHLTHRWPESIHLREADVVAMTGSCRSCHEHEYASWQAGPHSATYAQIFTNATQNSERRLMEDCLRCHGMFFSGSIRDLVQPQSAVGPWHLVKAGMANEPTMPCGSCHGIHREGQPESKPRERISMEGPEVPMSLAFYDRRERLYFPATELPVPRLYDGARLLKVSQDARQAVCYECHAPRAPEAGSAAGHGWEMQAGSGDDRTPKGVHEGLSCFSCHVGHNENVRASCKTCHPQMSNCGRDVETMDTTYANAKSRHNIHWVKCVDCHQHGIPKPSKAKAPLRASAGRGVLSERAQRAGE